MHLELEIPDDLARLLSATYTDLPRAAVEALALEGYRSRRLSDGQVRRILGFSSRMQVHAFLKEHGVYLNYALADLEQDRASSLEFATNGNLGDAHAA